MKRNFTRILAAFALLVGLTIPMGVWGQTTIYSQDGGGTVEGWTFQNNVTTNDIDKGTYWLLDAGDPSDYIQTMSYDLSSYSTANLSLKAATYGSGSSPQAVVQISFDGGNTFNNITLSGTQPTSNTYQTLTATITSGLTNNVVIKYSNGVTTGRGLRLQSLVLTASIGGGTQPETYTVTYNANVTGISPIVDTYNEGTNVILRAANTFTNEGYTFDEWNTQSDGDGDGYAAGDVIEGIDENIVLFAIWTENTTPSGTTATLNIQAYAAANNWVNQTQYTTATVAPVTFTAQGGGNTGKYYTNGQDWRYYQNESASITISVPEGYTLVSVKPTYSIQNGGVLKNGDSTIASGSTVAVSGTSVTFTVGNSGTATNGQVRFTNIDVVYVSDGGTQTASDLTITNQSTDLTFDLYNNTTAQVISYTTSSTGAITITPTESDYFSYVHDAAAKTITVTPTAVTPSAQTVTISQAADDDYYAGTATFTVSITNSAPLANIAALTAQTIASTYNVALSDAVVTYVNGNYAYIQDASGAVVMYKSGHGLTAGDVLNGTASVTYQVRNGNPQITDLIGVTSVSGTAPDPTEVAASAWNYTFSNVLSQYFKVTGTTITQDNNKYYVSLNNESIQLYKVGTAISGLDLNKTYSITGFPTMYNTTKELQIFVDPEVEASTEPSITVTPLEINVDAEYHQDDLTVTYTNVDPYSNISVAIFYDAEGNETNCSWLWVELKSDKNFRYTIFANDGGARTAYFKIRCNGVYSDMVTVNQDAYVTPPTPGNWVLTSIDELTEEDVFVIVGDNGDTYAMSNDNGTSSAPAAVSVAVVDNTLSGEIGDNIQWNISSTESGYIFYPNGTTETWLYCTNTNNGVRMGVNDNNVFIIEDGYLKNFVTERYVGIYNSQDWRCYKLGTDGSFPANIADQTFAFYKKVEEESYDLTITGYTNDSEKTGYHLIASPVTFDPNGTDMTLGDFDLYYFDQEGDSEGNEWMNWESNHFSLVPGTGYLYAKKATPDAQTYYFTLSGEPYNEFGSIPLTYNSTAQFAGWNLIGNPFGEDATLDMPFYRMNGEGSGLEAVEETNSTVYAMEGVFVNAFDQDYGVLSYANFTRAGNTSGEGGMKINLTRNRGTVIDNAIVRFDNGRQLPKFQLFENSTKLYIPQGNKDYAIVRSAAQGEMPVSFRASENGTYTIAVEAENVDMNYLHLIDNMTGADVDLLATPNYTFEARTNDYTSRFRLVFSANGIDEQTAETFAYFNGTNWTVSNTGDATLQVVDITGRIVSSETINGNATVSLNQPAGIYMLRLVNGNDVKVQKVVVR